MNREEQLRFIEDHRTKFWEVMNEKGLPKAMGDEVMELAYLCAVDMAEETRLALEEEMNRQLAIKSIQVETETVAFRQMVKEKINPLYPLLKTLSIQAFEEVVSVAIRQSDGQIRIVSVEA